MELRHLRYFVAVAEQRNFTRAAEKLFIAQPPLTRAIKQLEEEIGVELFIRKARGLELTSGGSYFLVHAQQILDKVEATVADTRRIALNRKTIFSIGFVPSVFYGDRKSTRLNSSHVKISYAVFCLKKKRINRTLAYFLLSYKFNF